MNTPDLARNDPWLEPFAEVINRRHENALAKAVELRGSGSLKNFASGHLYFGLHKEGKEWIFREWAPNAARIYLVGTFNQWEENESYSLTPVKNGNWEISLPLDQVRHGDLYRLSIHWEGGKGDRIPSYATRVVQDPETLDLVHSHAVKNENEGLGKFDGTPYQYFHDGYRREHVAWDSLCFDYRKNAILHFLLSNCRYWIEEYKFDGFRFDGVTSMLYLDHGLSRDFTSYHDYFDGSQDEDAITYLTLANQLIHEANPAAMTIAEEMSGMPGLAAPFEAGGMGFDFRLAMGTPDFWIKIIKEVPDEKWNVSQIYHELSGHRADERTIGYAESHDQALVGDKTILFRLIDQEIYWHMSKGDQNLIIDRGMALHKMIRLVTIATAGGGYLTFMGNEFGHPEWIDFPREGNNWSYKYARRQWSLRDNHQLKYHLLSDFDREMISLVRDENIFSEPFPFKIFSHEEDQVLACKRRGLLFIFNFNPRQSFTDYGIPVDPGSYRIVLNSDDPKFGGQGLVDQSITYSPDKPGKIASPSPYYLKLYIPTRTALVLKHSKPKSVR